MCWFIRRNVERKTGLLGEKRDSLKPNEKISIGYFCKDLGTFTLNGNPDWNLSEEEASQRG